MHTALLASLSLFGLLVFVGGIIGYVKAKSRASLISGIGSAILLGIASSLVSSGSLRVGAGLSIFISLALLGRFFPAFMKTKKVMPGGLVVALGAVTLVLGVLTLVKGT
jgi:uncharacterized membrane protein (UPF0136 family)